jgi:hypothetical protein
MKRVGVIIVAGLALAGCSSFSLGDWTSGFGGGGGIPLRLESDPPGADARTSAGPGCRTPCMVAVPPSEGLTVTFAFAGYETQTVPVDLVRGSSDPEFASGPQYSPNPVVAMLQPAAPPPPPAKKRTKPKPRTAAPAGQQPAPAATGTTRPPASDVPASQRSIPGSAPTTPPASAWPPPR